MKAKISMIGRIVFTIPLIMFGAGHMMNAGAMVPMVPVPGGLIWVYFVGVCLLAAAVSIIINKKASLATLLLGILLLIIAFTVHFPNMMSEDEAIKMAGMSNAFKDIGLAGAAFFMHGILKD